ncbi:MAG: (Fe-S)-binding protein [Chitinophagales bacterium]
MFKLEEYTEVMSKCSHCGYCQAVCPVYREDLLETHVARARVKLIRAALMDKTVPVTPRVKDIINRCLLCTSCTQSCPSGVPGDEIITAARIELSKDSGAAGAVKKFVLRKVLNQRGLAGVLGKAGSIAQKLNLGPKDMPTLASKAFDKMYEGTIPAKGEKKARVAYFIGCGTNFLYPDTGEAVVKVLTHNGFEVVIPKGIVCCGIPALAEGDFEGAQESVKTNIEILSGLDVDAIITDCTSCGMAFRAKALKMFPADDPFLAKVVGVALKMSEVTDYLTSQGLTIPPGALPKKVTYHVPCHRGWAPTVVDAPRKLVADIPEAQMVEMEKPDDCCGAAGTFYLEYRDLAESIRSHKLEDIRASEADTLITQCPVCRFYLSAQLKDIDVLHPIGLLAKSYGL